MVNGLLCSLVVGPLLGGMGTMVVVKRMAFFSQAVGNAALTGVAIAMVSTGPDRDETILVHHPFA